MLSVIRSAPRSIASPVAAAARIEVRGLNTCTVLLAPKKKVVDPTLPTAPRGPPTAYTLFFKDYLPSALSSHQKPDGKTDMKGLTAAAGQAWNNLTTSARESFEAAAKEGKKTYEKEYQAFWDSTTPETRAAIAKATGKVVRPPGGKKAYKASIAGRPGNPGKPLSTYFAFAKEVKDLGSITIPDNLEPLEAVKYLAKETGKRWKELKEEEKQKYKETYTQQKEAWEEWKKTQKDL